MEGAVPVPAVPTLPSRNEMRNRRQVGARKGANLLGTSAELVIGHWSWNCESFLAGGAAGASLAFVAGRFLVAACVALAAVARFGLRGLAFGAFFVVVFLVAICRSLSFGGFWGGVATVAMPATDSYLARGVVASGSGRNLGVVFAGGGRLPGRCRALAGGACRMPPTTSATQARPRESGQAGPGHRRTATPVVANRPTPAGDSQPMPRPHKSLTSGPFTAILCPNRLSCPVFMPPDGMTRTTNPEVVIWLLPMA